MTHLTLSARNPAPAALVDTDVAHPATTPADRTTR